MNLNDVAITLPAQRPHPDPACPEHGLPPTPPCPDANGAGPRSEDLGGSAARLLPTPAAGGFNDGEDLTSWQARRDRQKALGRNGNGMGTPLSVAVRLLPTPTAADSRSGANRTARRTNPRPDHHDGLTLTDYIRLAPTPKACDTGSPDRGLGPAFRPTLSRPVLDLLPTPWPRDASKGSPKPRGSKGEPTLPSTAVPLLPTPTAHVGGGFRSGSRRDMWRPGLEKTVLGYVPERREPR